MKNPNTQNIKCAICGKHMAQNGVIHGAQRWICQTRIGGKQVVCSRLMHKYQPVTLTGTTEITSIVPRNWPPTLKVKFHKPASRHFRVTNINGKPIQPVEVAPAPELTEEEQKKKELEEQIAAANAACARSLAGVKTFVISAAQNATPANLEFLGCLKTLAAAKGASLVFPRYRYKNATSIWTEQQEESEWWAKELTPYLWDSRLELCPGLVLLADASIQPTASNPLSGFDAMTSAASGIVGHPKVELKTIASPANSTGPKIMTTTGAVTVANYTSTKSGRLGFFHHAYAALLVEVEGSDFHIRHVHFSNESKSVIDLTHEYFADGRIEEAQRPVAVVLGDVHVGTTSKLVEEATFGKGGIVEVLQPEHIVAGDIFDGLSCNPHSKGDPFQAVALEGSDRNDVQKEVEEAWNWIVSRTPVGSTFVAVPDNHGDFLRRWLCATDWRLDPKNAEFYLKLASKLVQSAVVEDGGPRYAGALKTAFESLPQPTDGKAIRLLHEDESFMLAGIELGVHGHRGPNGSRGSIRNLRRLGNKSVIGHSHSPGIDEGTYQVGTSTELRLSYNSGPSSWAHCHCVVHHSGKRQLLFISGKGAWRRGN